MFVGNVDEAGFENNPHLDKLRAYADTQKAPVVVICAKMESEIAEMDDADKHDFLAEIGQDEPGLNRLIRSAFKLLGLQTYFTAGEKEVRAWTVRIGATGPGSGRVIHNTTSNAGFIRAQTIAFDDSSRTRASRAQGRRQARSEGKESSSMDGT